MPMFRFVGAGVNDGDWKEITNPNVRDDEGEFAEIGNGWHRTASSWSHIYQRIPDLFLSNLTATFVGPDLSLIHI